MTAAPSGTLSGERLAFTGTLASMTHRQAMALVREHGGEATPHVSHQTTMLIIGEEGWPLEPDGTPSVKLQQVNRWREEGTPIRVVSEAEWLGFLELTDRLQEVRRQYTPAMLSQLLGVSVNLIRRWERNGLIRPVRHVYRLPYFDFREVANARRLAELLESGVSRKQIEESLQHLEKWGIGTERSLAQLEILAGGRELLYRDQKGLLDPLSGQRLFDFDSPQESEEQHPATLSLPPLPEITPELLKETDWVKVAHEHLENNQLADAVEAYRMCLMDQPQRAEVHFQLADTLFRMDNIAGALERYHMAVELDPQYLEAWTQLGCVYNSLEQWESAEHAFRIALQLHPDYPDAHWHLAQLLERKAAPAEAREHWETYLQYDQRGPWADVARNHLGLVSEE